MKLRFAVLTLVLLASTLFAQDAARLTYSRSFKGSDPAFVQIVVGRDGAASFEVREKDDSPTATLNFQATPDFVARIFAYAATLNDFAKPDLEAKANVAFTGTKMFAFDDNAQHNSKIYTYTTNPAATQLQNALDQVVATGMHAIHLQTDLQFDHLGLTAEMQQTEQDWKDHQLAELALLAPTLQKVAGSTAAMNSARQRARDLLAQVPPAAVPHPPRF